MPEPRAVTEGRRPSAKALVRRAAAIHRKARQALEDTLRAGDKALIERAHVWRARFMADASDAELTDGFALAVTIGTMACREGMPSVASGGQAWHPMLADALGLLKAISGAHTPGIAVDDNLGARHWLSACEDFLAAAAFAAAGSGEESPRARMASAPVSCARRAFS